MKKAGLILFIALFTVAQISAQKRHEADTSGTKINWKGSKIGGSEHVGTINLKSGWITLADNAITGGEFVVDMKSIKDTDIADEKMRARLEGHLRSDDFFGVEKFPLSRLVLSGGSKFVNGTATVKGNLTIKEATHPVEFTVTESKTGAVPAYTATVKFDRSLYDVRFGSGKFFSNLGDNAIRDEIILDVRLVVKK